MKLILLLAGPYSSCTSTQEIWQEACVESDIKLETIYLDSEQGQKLAERLKLASFPALINDKKIIAVGHPNTQSAKNLISQLLLN